MIFLLGLIFGIVGTLAFCVICELISRGHDDH